MTLGNELVRLEDPKARLLGRLHIGLCRSTEEPMPLGDLLVSFAPKDARFVFFHLRHRSSRFSSCQPRRDDAYWRPPMQSTKKEQTQIRMDDVLKKRIRKYRDNLQKRANGVKISFSEAARSLIIESLNRAGV